MSLVSPLFIDLITDKGETMGERKIQIKTDKNSKQQMYTQNDKRYIIASTNGTLKVSYVLN